MWISIKAFYCMATSIWVVDASHRVTVSSCRISLPPAFSPQTFSHFPKPDKQEVNNHTHLMRLLAVSSRGKSGSARCSASSAALSSRGLLTAHNDWQFSGNASNPSPTRLSCAINAGLSGSLSVSRPKSALLLLLLLLVAAGQLLLLLLLLLRQAARCFARCSSL